MEYVSCLDDAMCKWSVTIQMIAHYLSQPADKVWHY